MNHHHVLSFFDLFHRHQSCFLQGGTPPRAQAPLSLGTVTCNYPTSSTVEDVEFQIALCSPDRGLLVVGFRGKGTPSSLLQRRAHRQCAPYCAYIQWRTQCRPWHWSSVSVGILDRGKSRKRTASQKTNDIWQKGNSVFQGRGMYLLP